MSVSRNSCKLFLWHLKAQDTVYHMRFVIVGLVSLLISDGELKIAWNREEKTTLFIGFCVARDHSTCPFNDIKRYKNIYANLNSRIVEHTKI